MSETKDLIGRILDGDAAAFKTLVERNQRMVSHIVFRMITNEADREDLCQEVFLRVYGNLRGFEFRSKLSTWIAKIAYNVCRNHLEKYKVPLYEDFAPEGRTIDCFPSDRPLPDEYAERQETCGRLQEEIDRLPAAYRTIITLFHLDDMSYSEIGDIMELPEGTVKSYLFRARRMLRDRLTVKYMPEELWNTST